MTSKLILEAGKEEEKKEDTEVDKPAEDAAAQDEQYIPAQSDDVPHEEPDPDVTAAASEPVKHGPDASNGEPFSNLPQGEASSSPDITTTAEPPVEETPAAAPTENTSEAIEPKTPSEPVASNAADAAAQTSEATSEAVESMEPDTQASEEVIEEEQEAAPVDPGAEAPVGLVEPEARDPDSALETQGEPVDPQQSEFHAEGTAPDDIAVAEASESSDGNPTSTDPVPGDISQDRQPTDNVPEESPSAAEADAKPANTEPTADAVLPDSEEIDPMTISRESENTPDSAPIETLEDPDEIVQIIDIDADGSTDDTAAIVVVSSSDDTAAIIVPPPPPSPGPHVTIAEPVKPPKPTKKKSSSGKHSKSRTSEKPKEKSVEKPVEIITLKEAKSKLISKGKSKKKSKSAPGKGAEMVPPPPPMIDVPPRAPSPPPCGTVIQDVEAEEVQVIDACAPGGDIIDLPGAEIETIEVVEADEAAVVAVSDEEQASAEKTEQNDDVTTTDISPLTKAKDLASPLEDGHPAEGAEIGADDEYKPEPTREELDSSPAEADPTSEEPQVDDPSNDNAPHDLPPHISPPEDEPGVAEPVTMESENHDGSELVTAKERTDDAPMAESPVDEKDELELSSPPNVESQADGELEGIRSNTADVASYDDMDHGEDEAESQKPSIELEGPEESIAGDILEEVSKSETIKTDSAEAITEPAPTLMELAALIVPSVPVTEPKEDTVVPEAAPADPVISTMEPAATEEVSDPMPEAAFGEDKDLNRQAVITVLIDEEGVGGVPPEAPMPPGTDSDTNLESGAEGEASQYQETEETSEKVEGEDIQPGLSPKVAAPVEAIEGDLEPGAETDIPEKVVMDGFVDSPNNDVETSEADASAAVGELDALHERVPEASEINADSIAVDAPEMLECQEMDIASPVVEEPDAVETVEAPQESSNQESKDTQVKQTVSSAPEQEALADSVDDGRAPDSAAPAIEQEDEEAAGVTPDPVSIPVHVTESTGFAGMVEKRVSADAKTEAEEVASQLVTDDVDVEQPAGKEASTEHVTEKPAADEAEGIIEPDLAADQTDKASEPLVVESGDEARETPEEHISTDPVEPPNTQDLSEQHIEPTPEYISGKEDDGSVSTINDTDNASTTTTGVGAETQDQDSLEVSMPVLAEEAQTVEINKTPEGVAEDLSKPGEEKIEEAAELVDTRSLEELPGSNEASSPGEQPLPSAEESATQPELPEPTESSEPTAPEEAIESERAAQPESPAQEPSTEAEVLPGDSMSQRSRVETLPDSEPAVDPPAQVEDTAPPPSRHSSKVSFDETSAVPQSKKPSSPPKERRKSSKSSSHRHRSSRHKVKDVSSPPPDQRPAPPPTQSRRRSSIAKAPPPGLFRTPSTTKPRPTRAEVAEQAEIRRRAAEIAAREQEVRRQLERARKRAALEEQEKQLSKKEEELARLKAIEREKKRAKREEHKRRAQEALEQERAAREQAEEEARQKEFERAERHRRRRGAESSGSRHHRDDRPRAHRQSISYRDLEVGGSSPIPVPKVSRHKTEDIGAERQRSRDEYYIREVPAPQRGSEQRKHRRSSYRDSEKEEKPKKGFWKSILGRT